MRPLTKMDTQAWSVGVLLFIAVFFGILAIISKHLWHERRTTQIFAFIAVVATILFMILVYPQLPD